MKVLKTLKIDITEDHVNELCDFLNKHDFGDHKILTQEIVVNNPKLFDYLFQPELCGWFIGNIEELYDIWGGDGFCEIYDVLDECGINYDYE